MRKIAFIASLLFSLQAYADSINLGDASKYNAFVKGNYKVTSSDVEGRVAVGGNLTIDGGYDIGTKINDFGMGSGPSLVVGGDINKTGPGNLNVYRSSTLPNPVLGDVVLGGTLNGGPSDIGTLTENSNNLPVDFDNAFAHLENLSNQLSQRTAVNADASAGWKLDFKADPNNVPSDNIYVFNVSQDQLRTQWGGLRTDWHLDTTGMAADATVVFNITNSNGTVVDFTQSNIFLNGNDPLSAYYNKGTANNKPPVQVLYNFNGASQLNLNTDLYGSILAPTADIKANSSVIWGQVIGQSWEGNMQINYNPFDPVGSTTPVPEPATYLSFLIALAIMLVRRKSTKTTQEVVTFNTCRA
ncbi:collagen-binding domain-containing protein [Colwelliaceae bacterium 6441]